MPTSVPDLSLAQMNLDSRKLHTFGSTNDVNVVEVRKQALTAEEMLDGTQGLVLPKSMGMRSPCAPPSPWWMTWTEPSSSSHKHCEGVQQNWRTKGRAASPP